MKLQFKLVMILTIFIFAILTGCNNINKGSSSNSFLDKIDLTMTDHTSSKNNKVHTYKVNIIDTSGKAVDVDSIKIKMTMKSMNHHTEGTMKRIDKGIYELKIELPMEGKWNQEITLNKGEYARIVKGNSIHFYKK